MKRQFKADSLGGVMAVDNSRESDVANEDKEVRGCTRSCAVEGFR